MRAMSWDAHGRRPFRFSFCSICKGRGLLNWAFIASSAWIVLTCIRSQSWTSKAVTVRGVRCRQFGGAQIWQTDALSWETALQATDGSTHTHVAKIGMIMAASRVSGIQSIHA